MLLNKTSLLAVRCASDDPSRPTLHGVYITPKETVATNGHCLIKVTHTNEKESDFPEVQGFSHGDLKELKPFILPSESALTCLKAIPKGRGILPIFQHVGIDVNATNANGTALTCVNNSNNPQTRTFRKNEDASYPNYDAVIPNKAPTATLCFNPILLSDILKTIHDMDTDDAVLIHVFGKDEAIVLEATNVKTAQKIKALVMPLRSNKVNIPSDYITETELKA